MSLNGTGVLGPHLSGSPAFAVDGANTSDVATLGGCSSSEKDSDAGSSLVTRLAESC